MNWRPVFAKQKYLTQTVVELAESLSMELQVCQLETLRDKRQSKINKTKLKAGFWYFLVKLRIENFVYKMIHTISWCRIVSQCFEILSQTKTKSCSRNVYWFHFHNWYAVLCQYWELFSWSMKITENQILTGLKVKHITVLLHFSSTHVLTPAAQIIILIVLTLMWGIEEGVAAVLTKRGVGQGGAGCPRSITTGCWSPARGWLRQLDFGNMMIFFRRKRVTCKTHTW